MDCLELEQYLHRHIPLSQAMGVAVREATAAQVVLSAPLAPNINHRETVFGGSASAVAILAAWALLHLRLNEAGIRCRLVIQRNTMRYERPIAGEFIARAAAPDEASWTRFASTLKRHHRARISATATLHWKGEEAGHLEADFVALGDRAEPPPA